jgi:hypothetical protein
VKRLALLIGLACLPMRSVHAQILRSSWEVEGAAGAGLDLALRGPWMDAGWRKPIPRALIFSGMSAAYEGLIDINGWSWKDVGQRAVGYAATELVIELVVVKILHH